MSVAKQVDERIGLMCDEIVNDPDYSGNFEFPYTQALWVAENRGGIEIENSNWDAGTSGQSFAPTVVYEFGDGSQLKVAYSYARIL